MNKVLLVVSVVLAVLAAIGFSVAGLSLGWLALAALAASFLAT